VKIELAWGASVLVIAQCSYYILSQDFGTVALIKNGYEFFFRYISNFLVVILAIWYPLYRTYIVEREEAHIMATKSFKINLTILLQSEQGVAAFLEFLRKEFSAENLFFFLHVRDWLELAHQHPLVVNERDGVGALQNSHTVSSTPISSASPSTSPVLHPASLFFEQSSTQPLLSLNSESKEIDVVLSQKANELMVNYLGPDAKYCVNLSAENTYRVCETIAAYNTSYSFASLNELIAAFEITQVEIFQLMETDSFFRFLKSPIYEQYKEVIGSKIQTNSHYSNHDDNLAGNNKFPESLTTILSEEKAALETPRNNLNNNVTNNNVFNFPENKEKKRRDWIYW